ncbi:MAG: DUF4271 domain-containing protein [Sphingobacteriales bacterium]|nr:MAG: DUF4271 domain-containing protein [Sphingobacteriales bacterium]TAF82829.1 MAG: DUF4271 domain-containing protein [Sphingobacteriales bacterium]
MRVKLLFVFVYGLLVWVNLSAQVTDSIPAKADTIGIQKKYIYSDSATIARNLFIKDSITHIQDSITWQFLKIPPTNRPNLYLDSLLRVYIITDKYLLTSALGASKYIFRYGIGQVKPSSNYWILTFGTILILYFAMVRYFFSHQIKHLFLSFYFDKYLRKINTDRNTIISPHFLLLFILFCLSSGTYIYLVTSKIGNVYSLKEMQLLLFLSFCILLFSVLNNIIIWLIGFVFNLFAITNQYLGLLYASMCNILFILLPLAVLLPLLPSLYIKPVIWLSVALLGAVYVVRFLKMLIIIVTKHTFSKTYIILYVCAFELCPLIVLIRALNIV